MTQYRTVYATFENRAQALETARIVVEEQLAACVNILPEIQSIYRWNGQVEQGTEAAFLAKTTVQLLARLMERIRQLHTYETPCVVAWEIAEGYPPYLEWIETACGSNGH